MTTRHPLIGPLAALLLLAVLVAAAPAQAASAARQQLEATVNQVLDEMKRPEMRNPATRGPVLQRIEGIIERMFSFQELAMRTAGPNWKTFNPDQRGRFVTALTSLLRETYLNKLEGYNGEVVSYLGETASSAGDKVEIKTSVMIKGKPVPVSYRMLQRGGDWVVYDVIIEGVSMVQNYRSQFNDLLVRGDVEALIAKVNAKAQEVKNQK